MNWLEEWFKDQNAFEAKLQKKFEELDDPECSPPIDAYPGDDRSYPQDYSEIRGV